MATYANSGGGGGGGRGGGGNIYPPSSGFTHDPLQLQLLRSRTSDELAHDILDHASHRFNECNISTAINKFWKFRQERERELKRRLPLPPIEVQALGRLFDLAKECHFQARQASTIVKAIGNGGFYLDDAQGIEVVKSIIQRANFQSYRPLEISHCVEAVTTLKLMDQDAFFQSVHDCLARRSLRDFNPVDISGIMYGFALCASSSKHQHVFELFAKELEQRDLSAAAEADMGKFDFALSRVAIILTAFAMSGYRPNQAVCSKLLDVANRKMRDLKMLRCSEVANLLWACHVLGLELQVGRELESRNLRFFNTVQIASMAWSSVWGEGEGNNNNNPLGSERFFATVGLELKDRKFNELKTHELVVLCWSLAKMRHPGALGAFAGLANEIGQRRLLVDSSASNTFTQQDLLVLAWAFSCAGRLPPNGGAVVTPAIATLPEQIKQRFLATAKQLAASAGEHGESSSSGAAMSVRDLLILVKACGPEDGLVLPLLVHLEEGERGFPDAEWIDLVYFGLQPGTAVAAAPTGGGASAAAARSWLKPRIRLVDIPALTSPHHVARLCAVIGRAGLNSLQQEMLDLAKRALELAASRKWTLASLADLVLGFTALQFYHEDLFQFVAKQTLKLVQQSGGGGGDDVLAICWSMFANGFISADLVDVLDLASASSSNSNNPHRPLHQQQRMAWACAEAWRLRFRMSPLPNLMLSTRREDLAVSRELSPVAATAALATQQVLHCLLGMGYLGSRMEEETANVVRVSSNVLVIVWEATATSGSGGGGGDGGGDEEVEELKLEDGVTARGEVDFTQRLWESRGFWTVVVPSRAWERLTSTSSSSGSEEADEESAARRAAYLDAKLKSLEPSTHHQQQQQ